MLLEVTRSFKDLHGVAHSGRELLITGGIFTTPIRAIFYYNQLYHVIDMLYNLSLYIHGDMGSI